MTHALNTVAAIVFVVIGADAHFELRNRLSREAGFSEITSAEFNEMTRIYWYRIPLFAAILPLGFLFVEEYQGNPLNPPDFAFLWLFGMAMLMTHLLIDILRKRRS